MIASLAGCASAPPARPAEAPTAAAPAAVAAPAAPAPSSGPSGLSFQVEPAEAQILIDGKPYGTVATVGNGGVVPLQPGLHQVSVKCAGYETWRAEVAVRNAVEPIRVTLVKRP